jgi:hypothetical protein
MILIIVIVVIILFILLGIYICKNNNPCLFLPNNELYLPNNGLYSPNNGLYSPMIYNFKHGGNVSNDVSNDGFNNISNNVSEKHKKLIFSDKRMNNYVKNNFKKFGWECNNDNKYIHFSFIEDHKCKKNIHGGDLYYENIHYHEHYENPHNKNLYSLIGEIKLLGNEFSDKKKLTHHFEKKDFFPKWHKDDIAISKGNSIKIFDHLASANTGSNVVTKYITNPLLYNNHKFNLQVYIAMYVQDDNLIQAFINSNYNMQVSKKPYIDGEYSNKDIHISNNLELDISNTELNHREKFLSKLLENKNIKKQVYHIIHECEIITKHFINKLKIHAIAAFELLTLDILIDENYKVWLLDMHRTQEKELGIESPKIGGKLGEGVNLHNQFENYWNWVLKNVIFANFGLHTSIWGIYNVLPIMSNEFNYSGHDHQIIDYYKLPKVVAHQLILQPLHLATEQELIELSHFGILKNVYQYISHGSRPWDISYIKKIYRESVEDSVMHFREYYHWLIIYDGHCVGYFGIRPDVDNKISICTQKKQFKIPENKIGPPILAPIEINCYQIRYFVSPSYQGKKLASMGGRHIVHFFKSIYPDKFLYAHIIKKNMPSIKTAESIGFHNLNIDDSHNNTIMTI